MLSSRSFVPPRHRMNSSADHFESWGAITGIGRSAIGRRLGRDPMQLTAEACLAAIDDAGLTREDIDGVSTFPGASTGISLSKGFSGVGAYDAARMLKLNLSWHTGGDEVPGQMGSIVNAFLAVASGLCNNVLCFRTVWEATGQGSGGRASAVTSRRPDQAVDEARQWTAPYGATALHGFALLTQRYFDRFGVTREQLGQVALLDRRHAASNPFAVYRHPMTLEDYLNGRMISSPLCLYDCDLPVDGSIAIIVSRRDRIDAGVTPIGVEAIGAALGYGPSAEMMWRRTELRPADLDMAQIYDGFSILTLLWIEALGLCGPGDAGSYLADTPCFDLGGTLPMNTSGGQLSAGRVHGYLHLYETCLQLWGRAEDRQVLPVPQVAVVTSGANYFSSCMLLTCSS